MLLFKPQAILFDLDGTLVDSVPDLAVAVNHLLQALAYELVQESQVRIWVGNGAPMLVRRALAFATQCESEQLDDALHARAMALFFDFYQQHCCDTSTLYPGVRQALNHWQLQKIPMACVTNKPHRFTTQMLKSLGLDTLLPVVVSGDTLAVKKPDPAPLLHACKQLGVAVSQCWMVGDSINDVHAARAAGMPVAAVSYGYNHGESVANANPDLLVDSLLELIVCSSKRSYHSF